MPDAVAPAVDSSLAPGLLSRAVGVVSSLMSQTDRGSYVENVRKEYVKIRD